MKVVTLFLILTLGCYYFSDAQNSQWQQYSIENGLPQSNITSIEQDNIGYLWIGTYGNGLVRFDGKEYKVFNRRDSLPSDFVSDLLIKNDSIFIATNQGLGIFTQNRIVYFNTPKINKIVSIKQDVYFATDFGIYQWKNNYVLPIKLNYSIDLHKVNDISYNGKNYWIATSNGLWKTVSLSKTNEVIKLENGNFTSLLFVNNSIIASEFSSGLNVYNFELTKFRNPIKNIINIKWIDNLFWVMTTNGLRKFSSEFKEVTTLNNPDLQSEKVMDIFVDKHKNKWFATSTKGIFKYTENSFTHYTTQKGLLKNNIKSLYSINDTLFLSNGNNLQYIINDSVFSIKNQDFLNTKINSFVLDSANNIWLGTQNKGLILLKKNPSKKDSTLLYSYINIGVELSNISKNIDIVEAHNNKIWIADRDKIHCLTTKNGIVKNIKSFGKNEGLKDAKITSFHHSSDRIWYGTENGNLGFIKDNQLTEFYRVLNQRTKITSLFANKELLFIGTSGNGVYKMSSNQVDEVSELKGKKRLNSQNIQQLFFDSNNYLWVGTDKGLNKIEIENSSIKEVYYFSINDGFVGVETTSNTITESRDGTLWFGTINGLTKLENTHIKNDDLKQPILYLESIYVNFNELNIYDKLKDKTLIKLKSNENFVSFHFKTVDLNHPNTTEYRWKLNESLSPWNKKSSVDFVSLQPGKYIFSVQSRNRDWVESDVYKIEFQIDKPWYLKNWFFLSVSLIIISIIVILLLYYTKKQAKKSKQKIEKLKLENQLISLEQKALQLQMNPHFIFNILNSVKAMGTVGKMDDMNETINEFALLLRGILQNSREEYVSLKEELKVLKNYLLLEKKLTNNSFDFILNVDMNSFDFDEIQIPPMLLQPFLENSIKHGFKSSNKKGEIILNLHLKEYYILCEIIDNGMGYKTSIKNKQNNTSLGLNVTKDRLKTLIEFPNFELEEIIENNKVNGTLVRFHLPYKTDF